MRTLRKGQAKIHDDDSPFFSYQDIFRLQVAMDHFVFMAISHAFSDPTNNSESLFGRERRILVNDRSQ